MGALNRLLGAALPLAAALVLLGACRGEPPELSVETASDASASAAPAAAPRAIGFDPPLGATGVDPARTTIAVTFDRPMDPEGWAWVVESDATAPGIGQSSWDAGIRTRTVEVQLEPGRRYVVWVNSAQYPYFRDLAGLPAAPVRWEFSTAPSAHAAISPRASAPGGPPRVVRLLPANGATDVDPSLTELRAVFDRPMAEGWSWVREEEATFPAMAGAAGLSEDRREAFLPVALAPGRRYVVWLNSEAHLDFRDAAGEPLPPLRWTFATRPTP